MCASFSICCNCCCCFHLLRSHVFLPYLFDSLWFTIQIAASFLQTLWMFWPLWKLQTWVVLIEYTSIFFANVLGTYFFFNIYCTDDIFWPTLSKFARSVCRFFFLVVFIQFPFFSFSKSRFVAKPNPPITQTYMWEYNRIVFVRITRNFSNAPLPYRSAIIFRLLLIYLVDWLIVLFRRCANERRTSNCWCVANVYACAHRMTHSEMPIV